MASLLTPASDSMLRDELLGFSYYALIGLFIVGLTIFVMRAITMLLAPKLLKTIIRSEAIHSKAIQNSDKALGTAVGSGLAYYMVKAWFSGTVGDSSALIVPELAMTFIPNLLQFILALAIVVWAFRLVNIVQDFVMLFDKDGEIDGTEKTLITALQSILRFCIVFVGSVFVADSLGFDLTSLIAGLGISGLALALAAKDTISNFFGAVTVLIDRPFKVGDYIIVDGSEGEVIEINLRTTILRTGTDTIITLPNANLVNSPVENLGKRRWRRWQSTLHLDINSSTDSVDQFCERVMVAINEHPKTMKEDASFCSVEGLSTTSLDIALNLYWDIASGVEERKHRADFIMDIKRIADDCQLAFYDGRIRQQR